MKVYFNNLGVVTSTDFSGDSLRQGSVGIELKAFFDDVNNANYLATLNFTRHDGTSISGIVMDIDSSDSECYKYKFNDAWFFAKAGETTLTIYLRASNGTIKAQGQVTFNIEATDYDGDPQITITQYNELLARLVDVEAGEVGTLPALTVASNDNVVEFLDVNECNHKPLVLNVAGAKYLAVFDYDSDEGKLSFEMDKFGSTDYLYKGSNVANASTLKFSDLENVNYIDGYQLKSNRAASWQPTPDDMHYPTEKLVKDSLDEKADKNGPLPQLVLTGVDSITNIVDLIINKSVNEKVICFNWGPEKFIGYFSAVDNPKEITFEIEAMGYLGEDEYTKRRFVGQMVSATNLTLQNILGSTTYRSDYELNKNKVTSWGESLSNVKYPSEKLVKDSLDGKVDKINGKGLSTEDFTTAEKTKLSGIQSGAQDNILEGVQVNGTDLPINNKKVNVVISGKADKVSGATNGNLASLDSNGNLEDSGIAKTSVATKSEVNAINDLIPSQASSSNKLADKDFVNSSIASQTSNFLGTYNIVSDLGLTTSATQSQIKNAIATHLASLSIVPTNNDYIYVAYPNAQDSSITDKYDRYKYNLSETTWDFEYTLNNSSFTAAEWAAIQSGITSQKVSDYDAHLLDTSNPHSVTKAQVGLGNVANTGDSATPTENGTDKFTTGGAYVLQQKITLPEVDSPSSTTLTAEQVTAISKGCIMRNGFESLISGSTGKQITFLPAHVRTSLGNTYYTGLLIYEQTIYTYKLDVVSGLRTISKDTFTTMANKTTFLGEFLEAEFDEESTDTNLRTVTNNQDTYHTYIHFWIRYNDDNSVYPKVFDFGSFPLAYIQQSVHQAFYKNILRFDSSGNPNNTILKLDMNYDGTFIYLRPYKAVKNANANTYTFKKLDNTQGVGLANVCYRWEK